MADEEEEEEELRHKRGVIKERALKLPRHRPCSWPSPGKEGKVH
jgi:hypothetical protein